MTHQFHFRCCKWQFPSINQLNVEACSIIFVRTLGQDLWLLIHFPSFMEVLDHQISKTSPLRLDPPSCHSSAPASGHPAWSPGHTPWMLNGGSDPAVAPEICTAYFMMMILYKWGGSNNMKRISNFICDFEYWLMWWLSALRLLQSTSTLRFLNPTPPFHKGPRLLCVWFHPVQHQNKWYKLIYYMICIMLL